MRQAECKADTTWMPLRPGARVQGTGSLFPLFRPQPSQTGKASVVTSLFNTDTSRGHGLSHALCFQAASFSLQEVLLLCFPWFQWLQFPGPTSFAVGIIVQEPCLARHANLLGVRGGRGSLIEARLVRDFRWTDGWKTVEDSLCQACCLGLRHAATLGVLMSRHREAVFLKANSHTELREHTRKKWKDRDGSDSSIKS